MDFRVSSRREEDLEEVEQLGHGDSICQDMFGEFFVVGL